MEKRGSLKVKSKKMGILVLFLLVVLVGCGQKNAEEMTIGEGSFHPDKNDEIVLEGSVSPKEIKYQVIDSKDKVILEGVTKNGLSDIKFKAPKKYDTFYTLKSGELEEEFYVYSVDSENEKLANDKEYNDIVADSIKKLDLKIIAIASALQNKVNFASFRKLNVEMLDETVTLRTQIESLNISQKKETSREHLLTALNHYERSAVLSIEGVDKKNGEKLLEGSEELKKAIENIEVALTTE